MTIVTERQRRKMLENGLKKKSDPAPVIKLSTPDGRTWFLSSLEPDDLDLAFGFCAFEGDIPQFRYVRLSWIAAVQAGTSSGAKRDAGFRPTKSLRTYWEDAIAPRGAETREALRAA